MEDVELFDHQLKALSKLSNGNILCGGVGSGKSRTAIAYYFLRNGGNLKPYREMVLPKDLYIITTARKRDTGEWYKDMEPFGLPEKYECKVTIDSWNNIQKYIDVKDAYFIFDEQRVVGYGQWSKTFIKISKYNQWILLTATPGDSWMDYIPVFIANGFYKHKTDFMNQHVILNPHVKFHKVDRYVGEGRLIRLRNQILVNMEFERNTTQIHHTIISEYDKNLYKILFVDRWNPKENQPITNASELCYLLRRVSNEDQSRIDIVKDIVAEHKKVIIFYNFNYERDMLLNMEYPEGTYLAEWTGHEHELIPKSERWVYLVQYTAGAEGWNCIETDTMIFYSQTYSYKTLIQAAGRIDRLNTKFKDLYYYHIRSKSPIDIGISRALAKKRNFNESRFLSI